MMATEDRVELGPGPGVVAVFDGVVLFVADAAASARLVEVARGSADSSGPLGPAFVRRLAALVASEGDTLADFGAIAQTDRGRVVLLRGGVAAAFATTAGASEHLEGTDSLTWVDRLLPADTSEVLIAPIGHDRPGASAFELGAGIVPGGWLRLVPKAAAAATEASSVDEAPAPPDPLPAVAEFELYDLAGTAVEQREPLPLEAAVPTDSGVASVSGVEVEGLACGRGHLNRPDAATCATCGAALGASARRVRGARPSLGVFVFDDGSSFGLDDDYVVGREPEIDVAVVQGAARPLVLDDPGDTVSRVHAEIRLLDWDVELVDRGSTNGTFVWDPSRGTWDQLAPRQPRVLLPGERGAVGRRTFVYEPAHRVSGEAADAARRPATNALGPTAVGELTTEDGAAYPLDRDYVIGRNPLSDDGVRRADASPIVVRGDEHVSRVHAHVTVEDGVVFVRDAPGSTGTFVAAPGAPMWEVVGSDPIEVKPGWSVRVGARVFTFRARAQSDA
jgi:pSer/pThr/pTyr-binding forkhead associated (FHA) protein